MVPLLAIFATPAHADTTAGAGVMVGTLTYTTGGVPIPPHSCQASTFSLTATSSSNVPGGGAIVVELPGNEFVGTLTVSGTSMDSFCTTTEDEFGSIPSINISGFNPVTTSTLSCVPQSSGFDRVLTHLHVAYQGTCSVNGHSPVGALVALELEMTPQNPSSPPAPGSLVSAWDVTGAVAVQGT
jgi:hypothetical protein